MVEKNLTKKGDKSMKKVRCPECGGTFEIELEDFDEGDLLNCSECNLELVIEVNEGKPKLRVSKEKAMEETDFDEFYEE